MGVLEGREQRDVPAELLRLLRRDVREFLLFFDLRRVNVHEQVAGLASQFATDSVQCGKSNGTGFVGLQIRQIRDRDSNTF
jgi:hypothetical protein